MSARVPCGRRATVAERVASGSPGGAPDEWQQRIAAANRPGEISPAAARTRRQCCSTPCWIVFNPAAGARRRRRLARALGSPVGRRHPGAGWRKRCIPATPRCWRATPPAPACRSWSPPAATARSPRWRPAWRVGGAARHPALRHRQCAGLGTRPAGAAGNGGRGAGRRARGAAVAGPRPLRRRPRAALRADAGAGFDAQVVARLDLGLKRRLGRAAYVLQGLRELGATASPASPRCWTARRSRWRGSSSPRGGSMPAAPAGAGGAAGRCRVPGGLVPGWGAPGGRRCRARRCRSTCCRGCRGWNCAGPGGWCWRRSRRAAPCRYRRMATRRACCR